MSTARPAATAEAHTAATRGAAAQPGQLLHVGFDGPRAPEELLARVESGRVGGVVLFARNVEGPEQLRHLVRVLHAAAPADAPLLLSIDQEGGRVQRLRAPWTVWPPMRSVGDRDDVDATRAMACALARELAALGIGLDFAPVMDVATEPTNPVIGDRSFGETPDRVARHGAAFVEALQAGGVAACAKHFPGHGDTTVDSHLALPVLPHDLERLRRVELPPFRAAIAAGVATVMTSHILFPALDPGRPVTFSPRALALLREELGFDGLVFSDDLEMKAVAGRWPTADLARDALAAGVDALLVCSQRPLQEEALRALESLPPARLDAALARTRALKARFAVRARDAVLRGSDDPSGDGPPWLAHHALAEALART